MYLCTCVKVCVWAGDDVRCCRQVMCVVGARQPSRGSRIPERTSGGGGDDASRAHGCTRSPTAVHSDSWMIVFYISVARNVPIP